METAPAPCQKAIRHRLLWLTGARGIARPAVPGCGGCGPAPVAACPHHLPALLHTFPVSGHSVSHHTPGVWCLSFAGTRASPVPPGCAQAETVAEQGWRRLTEGKLSFVEQKVLHKPAQQHCRFHGTGFCKVVPQHSSFWQG